MGSWSENIYGNDIAMDYVGKISELYRAGYSPIDIMFELKDNTFRNEEFLVLADFEIDTLGKIFYSDNTLEIIEEELTDNALSCWDNPEKRRKKIEIFKDKINNIKSMNNEDINEIDLEEWVLHKQGFSIILKKFMMNLQ